MCGFTTGFPFVLKNGVRFLKRFTFQLIFFKTIVTIKV